MDRRDHGLWDARGRADRVLEGADVGARLERAAGGVCVLREREQLRHWRRWVIGTAGLYLFVWGRGVKLVGAQGGEARDSFGVYVRSMPAENTFSLAEDRTTTRTVGSSAIQSNAAPYSRQNLVHVKVINDPPFPLDRTRALHMYSLFIECVDGWPNGE